MLYKLNRNVMAKSVKIQTAKSINYGHTVAFGDLELKFDRLGFAEVESMEVAERLAKHYEGWLFIGEKPAPSVVKTADDTEELKTLTAENARLKEHITDKEATITALTKENDEWKSQVNIYKEKAEKAEFELSEFKTVREKENEEWQTQVTLAGKTAKELAAICAKADIPAERYENKTKPELIAIILDESRK